jgi:hypothetical protein
MDIGNLHLRFHSRTHIPRNRHMNPSNSARKCLSAKSFYLAAAIAAGLTLATAVAAPRFAQSQRFAPPTAAELGLTGTHAQQWDTLRQETIALRRVGRDDLIAGMGEFRTLLDQPAPDLRGFSDESQRRVDAHMAEMRALRERQLDLYESLSPAEQTKVRAAMAQRLDRLAQLRQRLAGFIEERM